MLSTFSVPGLACYVLSLASTSVLVSLRKTRKGSSIRGYDEDLGYDRMFIPRVLLLAFVIVGCFIAMLYINDRIIHNPFSVVGFCLGVQPKIDI